MAGIIVAFPNAETGKNIRNILVRSGFNVVTNCTNAAVVLQEANSLQYGVVICTYKLPDMMYWELKSYLPPGFEMVAIAPRDVWQAEGDSSVVSLSPPLKPHELISTVEMIAYNVDRRRKKQRYVPRRRSGQERDLIDKAKGVLMSRNNMSEDEAHKYLQKCSMDNGTSLTETAQMILSMMD